MVGQVVEEVAVIRARVPTFRTFLPVGRQQLGVEAAQVVQRGAQVVVLQIVQRDVTLRRLPLQPQQRLAAEGGQKLARAPLVQPVRVHP